MAVNKRYQVTGECCHVLVDDPVAGPTVQLLYKGAFLPDGVADKRIKHLLVSRLITEVVDESQVIPPNASITPLGPPPEQWVEEPKGENPVEGPDPDPDADSAEKPAPDDTAARRDAAREKLAALGGRAPDGRHHPDVLVEYLVAQGGRYEDLVRAEKADLVEMVKARQG